jgi:aspartyl-tRNA(Asn)/glutamyl-tRNA(Gln) amidotransferase subunit C
MGTLDRKEVEQIARLARLDLEEAEIERLTSELSAILDYMERIRKLDTGDAGPMTHAVPLDLRLREDRPERPLDVESALGAAPDIHRDCFRVPHIIQTAEKE